MTDDERERDEERERQERPRIKVTDRRLFDREGNLRDDAEEARSEEPQQAPRAVGPEGGRTPETDVTSGGEPVPSRGAPGGPAEDAPAAGPRREAPGDVTADAGDDASSGRRPGSADGASPLDAGSGPADLPRDFAAFIESQYYETLLYLGAMPHPATGQAMEDLDMAQYKIDLLSMLQEKTEGNRTPEESKLLEDVLYQLRMGYLQKSKVAKL